MAIVSKSFEFAGLVQLSSMFLSPEVADRFCGSGTPRNASVITPVASMVLYSFAVGSAYDPASSSKRVRLTTPS